MGSVLKVFLYLILIIVALCLVVPLLCTLISWSTPYFGELFTLITCNPILTWIIIIALIVALIKFIIYIAD